MNTLMGTNRTHRTFPLDAPNPDQSKAGMALLLALMFAAVAVVAVGVLSSRLLNQKTQTDWYTEHAVDFLGLEAALAESRASMNSGGTGVVGYNGDFEVEVNENGEIILPRFDEEGVDPLHMGTTPEVEYFTVIDRWGTDGIDNNGNGVIDDADEAGFFTIYALARNNNVTRRAEVVYAGEDVNVWGNAIFARVGQTGGKMKGNASIRGSVHILGEGIPEGGEAMEMTGASLIHNNYAKSSGPALSSYLVDRVPPLPTTTVDGQTNQKTLNAKLRVRNGVISLNGSAEVGASEQSGNGAKDTMDGTFVNDGWIGNQVNDDGDRGDPRRVYSDNGWDEGYDLGDAVSFPTFEDDWHWPENVQCYEMGGQYSQSAGSTELYPDGTSYSHEDYFREGLALNNVYNGNVSITAGTTYYLNLTQGGSNPNSRVKADPENCVKGDTYIYYNKSTNVMEVNGPIMINGNLSFNASGGKKVINYTGRSAMLVTGNVNIHTSLLTCNDGDPNDYVASFPERNCIGVMAGGNMVIGDKSQLDILGAFYAEGNIKFNKQTVIMGSLVTSTFDMSGQVPDIYQVPSLRWNLPLGMIGNYPVLAFSPISWRELPAN